MRDLFSHDALQQHPRRKGYAGQPELGQPGLGQPGLGQAMTTLAPSAAIDAAQFESLLAMAGPGVAAQLTAQVAVDLAAAQRALLAAVDPINWADLRAQSHVVLGLAGVLGAQDLHQLAARLNAAAQPPVQNAEVATILAPETSRVIDAVLTFLSQRQRGLVAAK